MRNLRMMDLRMMETTRQRGILMTELSGRGCEAYSVEGV